LVNIAEQEWNLKPIVKDLEVKLGSHLVPLINKQGGPAGKPPPGLVGGPGNRSSKNLESKALSSSGYNGPGPTTAPDSRGILQMDPLLYSVSNRTKSVGSQDAESAARSKKE